MPAEPSVEDQWQGETCLTNRLLIAQPGADPKSQSTRNGGKYVVLLKGIYQSGDDKLITRCDEYIHLLPKRPRPLALEFLFLIFRRQ